MIFAICFRCALNSRRCAGDRCTSPCSVFSVALQIALITSSGAPLSTEPYARGFEQTLRYLTVRFTRDFLPLCLLDCASSLTRLRLLPGNVVADVPDPLTSLSNDFVISVDASALYVLLRNICSWTFIENVFEDSQRIT